MMDHTTDQTHVILAEDEVICAMALAVAQALGRKGLRVSLAGDGLKALDIHRQDPADLLITDMRMPRMGGAGLVAHLRRLRPDLPVIVLTGWSGELDGVRALGGPLAVLSKPVDLVALLRVVADFTGGGGARQAGAAPPELASGPLPG